MFIIVADMLFDHVETVDPCVPNPCQNRGTCHPSQDKKSFTCKCIGSFKPPLCSELHCFNDLSTYFSDMPWKVALTLKSLTLITIQRKAPISSLLNCFFFFFFCPST